MLKSQWTKKKQNNLIVLGILLATLVAVFLVSGGWREVWSRAWGRLWGSATIRWEKSNPGTRAELDAGHGTEAPARFESRSEAGGLNADWRRRTENTEKAILDLVKDLQGTYGVYVEDLGTGMSFGINEDRVFTAASLIKLPVFAAVYQEVEKGNLSLDTKYKILDTDKVPGAGSMYYAPAGTVYTYQEMLDLMGKQSDNTAQNIFVKLLGAEKIQAVIDRLGMKDTSFVENETTPRDVGRFFREVYQGNPPSLKLRRTSQGKIFDDLTDTIWEDRIPAGVPEGVRVVHKVGTEIGVYDDAGIVFGKRPFILVIMNEGVKETEAKEVLPKISSLIYADLETD